ncbi:MAG: hypothetical protein GWN84_12935 [Gammaproteobacteria bacterium]|nr:hypothetical protein [Gammaproteobacteria bacterium]NIR83765.1 hypothetical protein [Gammaproteobacteria bacterium]NIR88123.1 hypothetical protein [Gammaproteobacteria bacterium]NIU05082.1 hypothetical protein [Gammaproteobacteria bacterium]NIV51925.1 hypothetical protein [Gammaproteobacteria bacterium]
MLDDDVWQLLQRLPRGERSKAINAALAEWARSRKRADAARRMNTYRQHLPEISTEELVGWVREDRERSG